MVTFVTSFEALGQSRLSEEEITFEAKYLFAKQQFLLKKYDEAVLQFSALIEKDNLNAQLYFDLALTYEGQNEMAKALEVITRATKLNPTNPWYWLTASEIAEKQKDFLAAAAALVKLIELKPSRENYWRLYSNYFKAQNIEAAINSLDAAEALYGFNEQFIDAKVQCYLDSNRPEEALRTLQNLTLQYPDKWIHWLRLAKFQQLTGDNVAALGSYVEVLKRDPDNEMAVFQKSILSVQGSVDNALGVLIADNRIKMEDKIKSLIPDLQQAVDAKNLQDLVQLKGFADQLIYQYPEAAEAYALRGDIHNFLGEYELAVADFQKSLQYFRSNFDVWHQLMSTLRKLRKWDSMDKYADRFVDYYPNHSLALAYYSLRIVEADPEDAKKYMFEAQSIAGNQSEYALELRLVEASISERKGDMDKAISILQELSTIVQDDEDIQEYLGTLYYLKGDKEAAKVAWELAIRMGANKSRVLAKLQTI